MSRGVMDNITKIKWIYFFKSLFFFSPILTLFYFSRGLDTFQVVSLEAVLIGAVLLSEVPTGILADWMGRKYSLVLVTFLYVVGNVWTIFAYSYLEFLLIELLFGIGIAFGSGAIEALVYDTLKERKVERRMSEVWGSINAYGLFASVVAVVAGGYIARSHDPQTFVILIWLASFGGFLAFILSFFVRETHQYKEIKRKSPLILFRESATHVFKSKPLRKLLCLAVFTAPFTHVIMFLFQPYFQMANVENAWWGVAVAGGMLIGAFLMKYAHKIEHRFGVKKTLFVATIFPGVLYLLMAFFIGPVLSFVWYMLHKGLSSFRDPLLSHYQNEHIHSHNRATVLSVISMVVSLYLVVMRLAMGAVANHDLLLSFIIMGAIIICGAVLFRIDKRHITVQS